MPTPGVIFELPSLVDLDPLLERAQRDAAESASVPWSADLAHALAGMPLSAMAPLIAFRHPGTTGSMINDVDHDLRTRLDAHLAMEDLERQGDILDLLSKLDDMGVPVGVVSVLPPGLTERCLEVTNLSSVVRASTGDRGLGMPASTGLLLYLADALLIEPTRSVVVAHTETGVATARGASFFAVTDPTLDHDVRGDAHLASYRDVHVHRLLALAERRQPA